MEKLDKIINDLTEYLKDNKPNYLYNTNIATDNPQILYSGPYWDETEIMAAVVSLLKGKWIVAGESVYKFERAFGKKFNVKYAQMVNSGSSANLVLLASLKKYFSWPDDSEIIVSPVGFPTTISTLVQNRLKPVFIDIEYDTLNFDITKIEEKITDKTKAIFVSPVLGNVPDMDYLTKLCEKHNLKLIGDNCDSLGSKWDGKDLSQYYTAWTTSFYPAHHMSTGEGGMVCTDIYELKKLFTSFAWWGRDCHPAGTKIYTTNGIKNIEDVSLNDVVYTHNGNYKKVYELFEKEYSDKLYTIKSKRNEDIVVTKTHPMYIKRNGVYEWVFGEDIKKGDYLVQKIPNQIETPKTLNISYDTLIKKESFEINTEPDLFRLLGYWMAEGSLASGNKGSNGKDFPNKKSKYKFYRVDFAFNINEIEYIEDVTNLMKKYFNVSVITRKPKGNGVFIIFKTRKGYEFFEKYCNRLSYNKKLQYEFINYDKSLLVEFLKGYWRGDGSTDFQSFSLSTTSETLANQLRFILSRFDISPSILIRTPEQHTSSVINNKIIEAKHNSYNLVCYGDNYVKMGSLLNEPFTIKQPHIHTEYVDIENGYILHEITDISHEIVSNFKVYNFEVEDDHSFHANGIASHNCHCVGSANLLSCGTCGKRFDKWIDTYDGIMDHKYVFTNMGYNLKPMDLQGSIGLVQLKKFDEIDSNRKHSKAMIEQILLKYVDGIRGVKMLDKADTCWFGTPFICENKTLKTKLVSFLEENRIQTRNYFAGNILMHGGYKHLDDMNNYPNANTVLDKVFFLGAAPHYTTEIFNHIDSIFKNKWVN